MNGSVAIRAGSGADLEYRQRYPALFGVPKVQPLAPAGRMLKPIGTVAAAPKMRPFYVSADTQPLLAALDVSSPIKDGVIDNWVGTPLATTTPHLSHFRHYCTCCGASHGRRLPMAAVLTVPRPAFADRVACLLVHVLPLAGRGGATLEVRVR